MVDIIVIAISVCVAVAGWAVSAVALAQNAILRGIVAESKLTAQTAVMNDKRIAVIESRLSGIESSLVDIKLSLKGRRA